MEVSVQRGRCQVADEGVSDVGAYFKGRYVVVVVIDPRKDLAALLGCGHHRGRQLVAHEVHTRRFIRGFAL